jgi:hypothetical protein
MSKQRTVVLVLRSGKDFTIQDVELITHHINSKWKYEIKPRIVCLWDKASRAYSLGNIELIPLTNDYPGTWSRMQLYSPEMEMYRPFLYMDLDTAVISSLENIFDLVKDESQYIPLEDFYQKKQLATGLVWFPANSDKIKKVWNSWDISKLIGGRMDYFLRKVIIPDCFWQQLTYSIVDFKPKHREFLTILPKGTSLVCFHGKPRIPNATHIKWVNNYVND